MTKTVTLLVGLPASGKSTYRATHDDLVISTDDQIDQIAILAGKTYNEVFPASIAKAAKKAHQLYVDALRGGVPSIIVDQTNLSTKTRRRWSIPAFNYRYKVEVVEFEPPIAVEQFVEWERRLNSRPGKTIPPAVLNTMILSFVRPTKQEGFDKITTVNTW